MSEEQENPDITIIKQLQIDFANDPEKFSEWEHNFVGSLVQQHQRNGDAFGLTIKQKEVVDKLQTKSDQ